MGNYIFTANQPAYYILLMTFFFLLIYFRKAISAFVKFNN